MSAKSQEFASNFLQISQIREEGEFEASEGERQSETETGAVGERARFYPLRLRIKDLFNR